MKIDLLEFLIIYSLTGLVGALITQCFVNKLHLKIWKWLTTFPETYENTNED